MGWGSFLGEFAKGFANGYIEERGVKGTLEDLGSVASSVKEFFSNNNDEDGPDFWAIYNQYMEEEDYNSAIEFVEEYYSNQGLAQDYIYYYTIGNAQSEMKYDSEMLDKAIWNCQQAYRMCQKGTEDAQTIKAQLDDLTNFKRWSEAWDEMNTTIENELENHNTTGAINCLKSYYRKFENNEYDYWYWSKLFHIYEEEAHSLVDGGTEKDYDAVIDKLETALLNMKDMTDGDEDRIASCETNQETINNIKEFRLYAVTMFKIEEHLDKKEFQKATDVLEAYNSNDSCAYGFYYWMKTFRINRIKTEDSIENGKDISAELKVMENALRRANDLAQRDNDQGQLEIVKGASKLLDDLTNANKTSYETSVHNSSSSNSKEQEYLEEVQVCLADDGVITERERRLLDRLRKSLGISEARAAELEAMCNPQSFTAEEQEYADEVKACLQDDGVITSKERRLLERLAKSLGISSERAAEIELMIK